MSRYYQNPPVGNIRSSIRPQHNYQQYHTVGATPSDGYQSYASSMPVRAPPPPFPLYGSGGDGRLQNVAVGGHNTPVYYGGYGRDTSYQAHPSPVQYPQPVRPEVNAPSYNVYKNRNVDSGFDQQPVPGYVQNRGRQRGDDVTNVKPAQVTSKNESLPMMQKHEPQTESKEMFQAMELYHKTFLTPGLSIKILPNSTLKCKVCNVSCGTGLKDYFIHMNTAEHGQAVFAHFVPSHPEYNRNPKMWHYCEICDEKCSWAKNYVNHVFSKDHIKRARQLMTLDAPLPSETSPPAHPREERMDSRSYDGEWQSASQQSRSRLNDPSAGFRGNDSKTINKNQNRLQSENVAREPIGRRPIQGYRQEEMEPRPSTVSYRQEQGGRDNEGLYRPHSAQSSNYQKPQSLSKHNLADQFDYEDSDGDDKWTRRSYRQQADEDELPDQSSAIWSPRAKQLQRQIGELSSRLAAEAKQKSRNENAPSNYGRNSASPYIGDLSDNQLSRAGPSPREPQGRVYVDKSGPPAPKTRTRSWQHDEDRHLETQRAREENEQGMAPRFPPKRIDRVHEESRHVEPYSKEITPRFQQQGKDSVIREPRGGAVSDKFHQHQDHSPNRQHPIKEDYKESPPRRYMAKEDRFVRGGERPGGAPQDLDEFYSDPRPPPDNKPAPRRYPQKEDAPGPDDRQRGRASSHDFPQQYVEPRRNPEPDNSQVVSPRITQERRNVETSSVRRPQRKDSYMSREDQWKHEGNNKDIKTPRFNQEMDKFNKGHKDSYGGEDERKGMSYGLPRGRDKVVYDDEDDQSSWERKRGQFDANRSIDEREPANRRSDNAVGHARHPRHLPSQEGNVPARIPEVNRPRRRKSEEDRFFDKAADSQYESQRSSPPAKRSKGSVVLPDDEFGHAGQVVGQRRRQQSRNNPQPDVSRVEGRRDAYLEVNRDEWGEMIPNVRPRNSAVSDNISDEIKRPVSKTERPRRTSDDDFGKAAAVSRNRQGQQLNRGKTSNPSDMSRGRNQVKTQDVRQPSPRVRGRSPQRRGVSPSFSRAPEPFFENRTAAAKGNLSRSRSPHSVRSNSNVAGRDVRTVRHQNRSRSPRQRDNLPPNRPKTANPPPNEKQAPRKRDRQSPSRTQHERSARDKDDKRERSASRNKRAGTGPDGARRDGGAHTEQSSSLLAPESIANLRRMGFDGDPEDFVRLVASIGNMAEVPSGIGTGAFINPAGSSLAQNMIPGVLPTGLPIIHQPLIQQQPAMVENSALTSAAQIMANVDPAILQSLNAGDPRALEMLQQSLSPQMLNTLAALSPQIVQTVGGVQPPGSEQRPTSGHDRDHRGGHDRNWRSDVPENIQKRPGRHDRGGHVQRGPADSHGRDSRKQPPQRRDRW